MGRRVEKAVFQWVDDSWHEDEPVSVTRFVYDGWNVIEVLDATESGDPVVIRKQTWGLDLSGQSGSASVAGLHGAGGIGGLLAVQIETADPDTTETGAFAHLYDANGNVGQMVALASGYGGAHHRR